MFPTTALVLNLRRYKDGAYLDNNIRLVVWQVVFAKYFDIYRGKTAEEYSLTYWINYYILILKYIS